MVDKDLSPARWTWEDDTRKHEEVTGARMLNEKIKKANRPEVTHLKLNAEMYTTYAQMKMACGAHRRVD